MESVYREGFNYKWVQEQWEKNQYHKVQDLFDRPYDQSAGPSKIPAASLEIPVEEFGQVESVRLLVHHGICRILWKSGIAIEVFIDPEQPVGWFKIEGTGKDNEIKLIPPPYTLEAGSSSGNKVTGGHDLRRLGYTAGRLGRIQILCLLPNGSSNR